MWGLGMSALSMFPPASLKKKSHFSPFKVTSMSFASLTAMALLKPVSSEAETEVNIHPWPRFCFFLLLLA